VPAESVDDTIRALNAAGVQAWQVGRGEAATDGKGSVALV